MNSINIVVRIDRKAIIVAAFALVGAGAGLLWSETLTLATTYPSPSGIYNQLVTTGNSGTVPADTVLNRNAGNTILVPPTNAGGKVGIGMAPASKLSVAGGVQLGDDTSVCNPGKAGTLRWSAGAMQVCSGSAWGQLGGSALPGTLGGTCGGPYFAGIKWPVTACGTRMASYLHYDGNPSAGYPTYVVTACAAGWVPDGSYGPYAEGPWHCMKL